MSEHDTNLIAKYLANELSGPERQDFELRLQNEPELRQTVFADKFVEWSLRPHPLIRAKQIVDALGKDLWTEEERKHLPKSKPEANYSPGELADIFAPIKELEESTASRSLQAPSPMQALVLLPENGVDCKNGQLDFDFTEPLPFAAELTIMDNSEEGVLKETVSENLYEHSTKLDGFAPGRYYWRLRPTAQNKTLRAQYGQAIGWFFIRKELMPKAG